MSTAVKKTKYRASASSRGRERLQRVNRRFDLCAGILALLSFAIYRLLLGWGVRKWESL